MKKITGIIASFALCILNQTFANEIETNNQILKIVNHSSQCEVTLAIAKISTQTLLKLILPAVQNSITYTDRKSTEKVKNILHLSTLPPTQSEYKELQSIHHETLKCRRQMLEIAPLFKQEISEIITVQEWLWDNARKENKSIASYFIVLIAPSQGEMELIGKKFNPNDQNIDQNQINLAISKMTKKMEELNELAANKINAYIMD